MKAIRNISYGIPYQNAQGEQKWRSVPCGTLFYDEQEKRFSIKMEALPVGTTPTREGDTGIWLNCWPIEPRNGQQGAGQRQQRQDTVIEDIGDEPFNLDDIPF